jgi:hypothetical protein
MYWNVSTLITIFATILYGGVFTLVMVSKPLNRVRQSFAFYLLAMSYWSVSGFLTISGLGNVLTWFRVMTTGPLLMVMATFSFVQTLFGYRRKWAPYAFIYLILVIILTLFTNLICGASIFVWPLLSFLGCSRIFLDPGLFVRPVSRVSQDSRHLAA